MGGAPSEEMRFPECMLVMLKGQGPDGLVYDFKASVYCLLDSIVLYGEHFRNGFVDVLTLTHLTFFFFTQTC